MINIKKHKKLLIIPVVIILIAILCLYFIGKNRIYTYDDGVNGNTPGNLYNNGYYCENDGTIYFKNLNDGGSLYSMDLNLDNFEKINSDNVSFINSSGPYIFYSRMNVDQNAVSVVFNTNCTGLYRCKTNGDSVKSLYDAPTGLLSQCGNTIIYQHYDKKEGLTLYRVGVDGKNEKKISDRPITPGCFKDEKMYYSDADNNHYIMCYDVNKDTTSTYIPVRSMFPIINKDYIYYINIDKDYCICRRLLGGTKEETVVPERVANYNVSISGKYLFYQTDGSDNNKLCKIDLTTGDIVILMEGNYQNINVTSNYVFFNQYKTDKPYYLENGTNIAKAFNPPYATAEK